jgi:hypothetical protein
MKNKREMNKIAQIHRSIEYGKIISEKELENKIKSGEYYVTYWKPYKLKHF